MATRGRKPHQPTEETRAQVRALRSFGIPGDEVAKYIGIDKKTLYKHYGEEIKELENANGDVREFLYTCASGKALKDGASYADCVRAAMFWAKTRMQWHETNKHEISGADGGPIETKNTIDPSKLDDKTLEAILAAKVDDNK